jgi:hypothetical protein
MFPFPKKKNERPADWDVFISYARKDRKFVKQLEKSLSDRGVKMWYDVKEVGIGDSIFEEISKGLSRSRFIIAVFSKNYFRKYWPMKELISIVHLEAKNNRKMLLPILKDISHSEVTDRLPLLADVLALDSKNGLSKLVNAIMRKVRDDPDFPKLSRKLNDLILQLETESGRKVKIVENKNMVIQKNRYMPGGVVPPFTIDPDCRNTITVYYPPGLYPQKEEEAALANVLMISLCTFQGYPHMCMSPTVMILKTMNPLINPDEIQALQMWIHQGMLNLVSEERIYKMGFRREDAEIEALFNTMFSRASFILSDDVNDKIDSFNKAIMIYKKERCGIPKRIINSILDGDDIKTRDPLCNRIHSCLNNNNLSTPKGFQKALDEILSFFDIRKYIEYGYYDLKTGYIKPKKSSFRELMKLAEDNMQ